MFSAVTFGSSGAICLALGVWLVWRQHRRHASTLASWGVLALGVGQLIRAAGSSTGDRQPLGDVLATCSAAISVVGFILVACGRDTVRSSRRGWRRRKLPPIRP